MAYGEIDQAKFLESSATATEPHGTYMHAAQPASGAFANFTKCSVIFFTRAHSEHHFTSLNITRIYPSSQLHVFPL